MWSSDFWDALRSGIAAIEAVGPADLEAISEASAIDAIKRGAIASGDVIVLVCGGPAGAGMQEIYQITAALKNLPFCKHVAVLTDARFSGVSTGLASATFPRRRWPAGPSGACKTETRLKL
jgi:xylonate dehydratase